MTPPKVPLDKVYAYLVLQVVVEPTQEGVEIPTGWPQSTPVDSILLSEVNHGNGTHTISFENGPATELVDMAYIGTGVRTPPAVEGQNPTITFDLGTKRVMNLVSIGLSFEEILTAQVHQFADQIKESIEETLSREAPVRDYPDLLGNVLRGVDSIEKHFWDRKR